MLIKRRDDIRFTYTRILKEDRCYLFIYDPSVGETFILDKLGALIWEITKEETPIDTILNTIFELFGLSSDKQTNIQEDILRIIRIMKQKNILLERVENYA